MVIPCERFRWLIYVLVNLDMFASFNYFALPHHCLLPTAKSEELGLSTSSLTLSYINFEYFNKVSTA